MLTLVVITALVLIVSVAYLKITPVELKDVYNIYRGQPGSILCLAHKCMLAQVCSIVLISFILKEKYLQYYSM